MRRKFLSVVLCVCMMLTMAPFAFAKGSDDTSTTNTQEQAPVANSSGSGSGSSTISVKLPNDNTGNLTISTNNAVLDGRGLTYTNGTITVTAANVTIQNLTFGDKAALVVNTTGEFTLTGCTFTPTTTYAKGSNNQTLTSVRTAVTLNVGEAVVTNNTFNGVTNGYYNAIEFGINGDGNNLSHATITGNTFNSAIQNNYFNFYNMTADAVIDITGNHFLLAKKGSNAIRISNFRNVSGVTFNVNNNEYTYANDSDESQYEGFILLEDYSPEGDTVQDFSGITININNLTSPSNAKQLFYVYDDQDGIIARNQPIVKGDDTISKFIVAKIDDNLYTSLKAAISAASDGQTVTLLKDTTESVVIPANRNVTFDLNGNKLTAPTDKRYDAIVNYGTLTINDSKKTGEIISNKNSGIGIGANSNTTIVYAKITGQEGAIGGYQNTVGATLTINDGIFNGIDNAVVIFNGSEREGNANTITINSGTFNGTIKSNGYIACGIYAPWKDNIIVKGGTFNITGGAGIVARAGTVTIAGGEFNTTGNTTGYVGDSKTTVPCSALVFDSRSSYPAKDPNSKISVQAGKFKSDVCTISFVNSDPSDINTRLEVTGGYFTSDPTAYLATDKAAVESDLAGYNYKVDVAKNEKADVAAAKPEVSTPVLTGVDKEAANTVSSALSNSTDTVIGNGLTAAANTIANNNTVSQADATDALKQKEITTEGQTVRIVVQTYMNINIKNIDTTSADKKTLSLDITPMYRTVATTANTDSAIKLTGADVTDANAVPVGPAGKLIINKPVTIKIPLPTDFVSPATTDANAYPSIYVQHKGYEYTATVSKESDTLYATFTNPHGFSTFTITTEQTAEATLNGVNYTSFQDAVNAANKDDVITVLKDNLSATMSGSSRTITVKNGSAASINVTVNGDKQTLQSSSSHNFTYTRPSSGGPGSSGGSISAPTTYAVNVNAATNGAVAADKKTASKGTTVTVTASPSKGYVVDAVKVVDKDSKDVAVTEKDGKYVFTMPASAVTVTGSFKAETPAPAALPFTDVKSGNWFYDAVKYAYEQGLMTGTSATTFAPNGTMNRAMIVTVLYRLEKSPAVTGASKFTDVPAGQWYSDAVAWAAANKIVNGYDETTFGPMNAVTREQMAAILFRYEQVKGLENVTLEENLNRFPDQNKISAYAIPALQWAVGQKIINGNADGTLDPTGTATRAQVAQIFTNLLNQ